MSTPISTGPAAAPPTTAALAAENITIKFGGLTAVDNVSFDIPKGGVVSLIGPNGAGKTTFFNVLTGLYKPTSGRVRYGDRTITGLPPHRIASGGIARTFQNIRLFGLMTAEENVMVAMHSHLRSGLFGTILRTPGQRREEREARAFARELLDFVGIGQTAEEYARNLSYGDQRRLEVARALALRPKVLLLDEPTAGMNPQESHRFTDFVYRVRDEKDVSILLIEHDMSVVMEVSERITVLDRGQKIAEGSPQEIRDNPRVVEAYLGKSGAEDGVATVPTAATGRKAGTPMLEVADLHVYYGNIAAVQGLSMTVHPGEIVTLIGSNGAGKSTTLRTISGLLRPRTGTVTFEGRQVSGMAGHDIVGLGVNQSPEGRRIFPKMTVDENLELGAYLRNDRAEIKADKERVLELFPRLRERIEQKAGTMSGGEQQMLAVGRALMGRPKLLLLDEPSMGLAPVLVDLIFEQIERIREQGTTVLLVEQNALAALRVADYAYVLESGTLKLEGDAARLARDPDVVSAYLGG